MNRAQLTREDYDRIRALRDARVRERTARPDGCAGCGCPLDVRTIGCKSCAERHRARQRIKDPVYRQKDAIARQARRRRARERKAA